MYNQWSVVTAPVSQEEAETRERISRLAALDYASRTAREAQVEALDANKDTFQWMWCSDEQGPT